MKGIKMKLKIIIISIFLLSLLGVASAESGSIVVVSNTQKIYSAGDGGIAGNALYTQINYDSTNYNRLDDFQFYNDPSLGGSFTFAHDFESTTFTITAGGTGGGVAWYDKNASKGYVVFNSGNTYTSSPLTLSYETNVFSNITLPCNPNCKANAGTIDANNPVKFGVSTSGFAARIKYTTNLGSTNTEQYNVTYSSNLFTVAITKSLLATKYFINNTSGNEYTRESSFNTNSFNFTAVYNAGIVLNATMSSGAYTSVTVNTTGCTTGCPATPTPTPTVNPVTGKGIIFDSDSYTIGQTANISWVISDSIWNTFITNTISIRKIGDDDPTHFTSLLQTAPQNGTIQYTFYNCDGGFICGTGGYEVVLYRNLLGIFETSRESDSANVFEQVAYVNAPLVVNEGQSVNVNWKFGIATTRGYLIDDQLNEFGVSTFTPKYYNLSCPCSVSPNSTALTFIGVGKHRLTLHDVTAISNVASQIITVMPAGVTPGQNITQNYFVIDASTYNFGDIIYGQYQISDANWTTYPFISVALVSASGIPMNPGLTILSSQTGTFVIPIEASQINFIQGGSAFVNMTFSSSVFNSTSITAASIPITINLNKGGWSIFVDKTEACNNQPIKATYTSPTGAGILQASYFAKGGSNKNLSYSFNVNGSKSIVIPDANTNAGVAIDVQDSNGIYQIGTIVKIVNTGCTPVPTTTATPGVQPEQQVSMIIGLLTNPIAWSIGAIFISMVVVAWAVSSGKGDPTLPSSIAGLVVLAGTTMLGWMPLTLNE